MSERVRHIASILAVAITAALLISALPAGATSAATGPKACRVINVDKGIGRDSLQRAAWAAEPGDTLLVRGTCVGTTRIKKNLTIGWLELPRSGTPTLKSGSWRPTIVVDPSVTNLRILPGLRIQHGLVVDQIADWRGRTRVAPATWQTASTVRSAAAPVASAITRNVSLRSCQVTNKRTGNEYASAQAAVDQAQAGDDLLLRGKCGGTVIDKSLHIQGVRMAISSIICDKSGCTRPALFHSGVPVLRNLTVAAGVDDVTLKHLSMPAGFAVKELAP